MCRLRVLLGVIAVLFLCGFVLGQAADPPKLKGTLPPNYRKLGLTDTQVQQIYKVQADYDAKIEPLQQQIETLKAELKKEREKVLTDAQRARLKEILTGEPQPVPPASDNKEEKKEPEKKAPEPKVKGTLPRNWGKLGLSEEQIQKIYRIQNDYTARIDTLEAQVKQLKDEEKKECEKVLTAEQKARLKEILTGAKP